METKLLKNKTNTTKKSFTGKQGSTSVLFKKSLFGYSDWQAGNRNMMSGNQDNMGIFCLILAY